MMAEQDIEFFENIKPTKESINSFAKAMKLRLSQWIVSLLIILLLIFWIVEKSRGPAAVIFEIIWAALFLLLLMMIVMLYSAFKDHSQALSQVQHYENRPPPYTDFWRLYYHS